MFDMLYKVLITFARVTIQMKAIEQYVAVVLFIFRYKMVLTFGDVDKILKCDDSNESCRPASNVAFLVFIILLN